MYYERYSIKDVTIKKIYSKVLGDNEFIYLPDEKERLAFFEEILKKSSETEGLKPDKKVFTNRYNGYLYCSLDIEIPCKFPEVYSVRLSINTDSKHRVEIGVRDSKGWNYFAIRSFDDIINLRDAFVEEYEEAEKRRIKINNDKIKRGKLHQIKRKAILAHIEELAKEEGFEYDVVEMTSKIKLKIRLTKHDYMEIDIPYRSFQEVLSKARETWHYIKNLTDQGVPIRIKKTGYTTKWEWKKHEKTQ